MDRKQPSSLHSARLVDAVVPDPPSGRLFQALVDGLLADKPNFQRNGPELKQMFATWRSTAPIVGQIIESHPQLQEAAPRAAELEGLGQLGQEALNYLQTGTSPSPQWVTDSTKKLDEAGKPKGLVRYAVADSLRKLVQAATMPSYRRQKKGSDHKGNDVIRGGMTFWIRGDPELSQADVHSH